MTDSCFVCVHEQERALQVCTYSRSGSDAETEPEGPGSALGSPQRTLVYRAKEGDSGLLANPVAFLPFVLFFFQADNLLRPQWTGPRRP